MRSTFDLVPNSVYLDAETGDVFVWHNGRLYVEGSLDAAAKRLYSLTKKPPIRISPLTKFFVRAWRKFETFEKWVLNENQRTDLQ